MIGGRYWLVDTVVWAVKVSEICVQGESFRLSVVRLVCMNTLTGESPWQGGISNIATGC